MRGTWKALWALALVAGVAGCTARPSEEACERAVANIRQLTGQTHTEIGADRRATIRSCRAQSSPETVECMAEAQTSEELFECGGALAEKLKKQAEEAKKKAPPAEPGGAEGEGASAGESPGAAATPAASSNAASAAGADPAAGAGAASAAGAGAAPAAGAGAAPAAAAGAASAPAAGAASAPAAGAAAADPDSN